VALAATIDIFGVVGNPKVLKKSALSI